jgi:hypothetical protein
MKRTTVALTSVLLVAFAQSVLAQSAIETALQATVTIEVTGPDGLSHGSGFITSSDGMIITAAHVIAGATSALVRLQNGEELNVEGVIMIDGARDFAIVRVAGFDLPTVPLGNADDLSVGQRIIAIGAPTDPALAGTVSDGLVSSDRMMDGTRMLQISVPVSPGSSGGPVMTEQGEVIGLVVSGITGGDSQNLNFALPINYVRGQLSLAATRPLQALAEVQVTTRAQADRQARPAFPARVPDRQARPTPQTSRSGILALRRRTKVAGIALASAWGLTVLGNVMISGGDVTPASLPVVGPWVEMALIESDDTQDYANAASKGLLITSGLLQAGLLVYVIASYSKQNSFASGFTISPVFNPRGSGISFRYRF